jgi:plasmid stability protein
MNDTVITVSKNPRVPSMLIREIPDDLHRRLRVAAAYRDESLSALGLRAVEREVTRVEAEMERDRRKHEGKQ